MLFNGYTKKRISWGQVDAFQKRWKIKRFSTVHKHFTPLRPTSIWAPHSDFGNQSSFGSTPAGPRDLSVSHDEITHFYFLFPKQLGSC